MGVPCPRCGRETSILVRGLCPRCFAEVYGLASLPARVEAPICRYCYSVRLGGRWIPVSSFEEAVYLLARRAVEQARPVDPVERVSLEGVEFETTANWTTRLTLRLQGLYKGHHIVGEQKIVAVLRPSICPTCKTRVSGEYDTVLQVRGGDPERVEGLVEKIVFEEGLAGQTVDLIRGRDGVDVYFTNPGAARKLAKRLRNILGGTITRVYHETVGRDSSGRIRSRRTIVLRIRGGDNRGAGDG